MCEQEKASQTNDLATLIKDFTVDQLRYLAARPYVRFDKDAAEQIGVSPITISRWKNRAEIDRAVSLIAADGILVTSEILRRHLPQAAQVIIKQLDSRNPMMQHRAAVDILDRAMGRAVQRSEISGPGGKPIETKDVDGVTDEERVARIAALLDEARARRTGPPGED